MTMNPYIREGRTNFKHFDEWQTVNFTALTDWVNVYPSPDRSDSPINCNSWVV